MSSFTVSDLKSFTAAAAQATAAPGAATAAPAAANGEKKTGIGATPVSSFTVSDLAAFTGGAGQPASATGSASAAGAAPSPAPAANGEKQVGIGAKVVGYCILDQKALMDATGAWPEVWGQKTDSAAGGAYGAYGAQSGASYASSWVSSAADASMAAASGPAATSRTFTPTTTGIGAKTLASFSTKLE